METPRARAARFCAGWGLRVPILQAPMAGASPPALAAAVANAGGMGGLGALTSGPDAMLAWGAAVRAASNGAFQVNLWVPDPPPARDPVREDAARAALRALGPEPPEAGDGPWTEDYAAQCAALLRLCPAVASSVMGLFEPGFVAQLKARGIRWVAAATTLEEALAAEAAGADAVAAQGSEAGGHRGSFEDAAAGRRDLPLMALLPRLADALRVPVIAAGGIMDGRGVAAALCLGASAVQMGTAFLRCPETALPAPYARALAAATGEDTVPTRAFSGRLARSIANDATRAFESARPAPYPIQRHLAAPMRAAAQAADDPGRMQLWAGQGVALGRAEPAGELVARVWREAEVLLA
ncbi:NAD(P)H-dependent flavin oxidoreductase [Roseococcus sp. DSY-14]|uniref:NAD(P)H-dependent flavin oxidoreductase n=1 Tax=Roseococcus sp. DSY-14 TaxID=3369650 RepID=UPI00387AD39E